MATYRLIQTVTVGSGGAANIEFTSIPQTFTDLVVMLSLRTANASVHDTVLVQFNSSAANFTGKTVEGDGSTVASGTRSDGYVGFMNASTSTASVFSNACMYICDYTSSNHKSYAVDKVSEQNATTAYQEIVSVLRANTAAVTSLKFLSSTSSNLVQFSSASLYGIKNS